MANVALDLAMADGWIRVECLLRSAAGSPCAMAADLQLGCPIADRPKTGNLNFDQIAVPERVLG